MFGVSLPELIVVFVVMLVVLGPEKLPEVARAFGKIMAEFRKHSNELRREFYNSVYTPSNELRTRINTEVQQLRSVSSIEPAPQPSASEPVPARQPGIAKEDPQQSTDSGYVEEKKH